MFKKDKIFNGTNGISNMQILVTTDGDGLLDGKVPPVSKFTESRRSRLFKLYNIPSDDAEKPPLTEGPNEK